MMDHVLRKLHPKTTYVLVIFLVVLSCLLRFWHLGDLPQGFHADEAAFGYNTYSLLQTGKDEYGTTFPLILKSFGDYKGALYSYISLPFVAFFGLNEFSVRLPTAIFGTLAVLITYALVLRITKKRSIALVAGFLSAINPSAIFLSRVQSDPLVAGTLFLLGAWCLLAWIKNHRTSLYIGSVIFFSLAGLGYVTTRVFSLIFIPIVMVTEHLYKNKKQLLLTSVLFAIVLGFGVFSMAGGKSDRLLQVNPFTKIDVQLPLDEAIREDGVMEKTGIITRVMHNKVISYGRSMGRLAVSYLSPEFLFFQSEQPLREKVSDTGVFLFVEIPFLLAGLYFMIRNKASWRALIISWIIFGVLSLSFASAESPNIHRFFVLLVPFHILSAYGIVQSARSISSIRQRRIFSVCIVIFCSINVLVFLHQLFVHQPSHKPYFRGFAYKELVSTIPTYYNSYQKIIVTKGNESPYIYFLFFSKYNPKQYQDSGSLRDLDYQGFDKYIFVPENCPSFNGSKEKQVLSYTKDMLLIRRGGCQVNINDQVLQKIYWRDGAEAFQIVSWQATPAALLKEGSR